MITRDPSNFRELAGTIISVIIIACYLSIGFAVMAINTMLAAPVAVPADWNTTMQSLANIALGYLIGKQTVGQAAVSVPVGDAATTTVKTNK